MGTSVPPPNWSQPSQSDATNSQDQPTAPSRRRSRLRLLVAGAAAVLAAAGYLVLGSSGGGIGDPVAQAAVRSADAAGFQMRMSIAMSGAGLTAPVTMNASGAFDAAAHRGSMSVAMDLAGVVPGAAQQLGTGTLQMQMLIDGMSYYVRLPDQLMNRLPTGGKHWVKVDLATFAKSAGLSALQNPAAGDPSKVLQSLRSVSGSVVAAGHERIGGIDTTRYQATLKPGALPNMSGVDVAVAPVQVWVDSHELVRRMQMTLTVSVTGRTLTETATMDFSHYGPQAPIAPPAASDVMDISGLQALRS